MSVLLCQYVSPPEIATSGLVNQITLGIIVTISLFIISGISKNLYARWKELRRLRDLRLFVNVAFENLLESIEKQRDFLGAFVSFLQETSRRKDFPLRQSIGFHNNNIKVPSREDIFKAFVIEQNGEHEVKSKSFAVLFDQLELVDFINKYQKEDLDKFMASENKFSIEVDTQIGAIIRHFKNHALIYVTERKQPISTDELLNKVDLVIGTWMRLESKLDIYVKNEKLINPLWEIVKEDKISDFRLDLEELVLSAVASFNNYERNREMYSTMFKARAKSLNSSGVRIKRELTRFNILTAKKLFGLFPSETEALKSYKVKWLEFIDAPD